jgi:diguanylate cyclase (GGDEF)-like protein
MRVLKSLVPIVILFVGAIYAYQKYPQLPVSVTNGLAFLPHMLAIMVVGLSIHFNRSAIFFYVSLLIVANAALSLGWADSDLNYGLLSVFLPLLLLGLTVFPDRGIISVRAIPAHALLIVAIVFSIYAATTSPSWIVQTLLSDWLPAQYFDWTRMSQTALIIAIVTLFYMLVLCILKPSPHMAAGFGVLVLLIAEIHFGEQNRSLNVFSSAALLMCLYAIMQESWRMAYLDELTGLPGRRALREKFQRLGGIYTVAMLDVDHFKKFNDTFGHDTGDAVLRMIAAKMTKVSGGGSSYRYGGEEFTIVFNGRNTDEAWPHLDSLRSEIANSPFVVNRVDRRKNATAKKPIQSKRVRVTVSIGIADSRANTPSPWDVLKLSDKALYRAKGKGRNCVCE